MRTAAQISVAGSVTEVFAAASRRLHELVPHDAAAWVMIDPATGVPERAEPAGREDNDAAPGIRSTSPHLVGLRIIWRWRKVQPADAE
jgi:hypothetical protein